MCAEKQKKKEKTDIFGRKIRGTVDTNYTEKEVHAVTGQVTTLMQQTSLFHSKSSFSTFLPSSSKRHLALKINKRPLDEYS